MQTAAVKNGKGTQADATPKDTQKGAAALAAATAKTETLTPLQERLRKINQAQKLSEKRKRLVDALDKVNNFEEGLTGEDDCISLETRSGSLEVTKPDAVKEVVLLLRANVSKSLAETDAELLAATI